MWGLSVALCACIPVQRDPKQSSVSCGWLLRDLKATLHILQAPERWPWSMWESSYGAVCNNSSSGMKHKGAWSWQDASPQHGVWWESETCLSSELTQCLQQLKNFLCMPRPLNESRIGHWCQSSPAALKQQPGLGAGHKPPPVWHCPCHSASTGTSAARPGNKLLCRGQWECKGNQPNRNDPIRIKGKKSKNEGEERKGGKGTEVNGKHL